MCILPVVIVKLQSNIHYSIVNHRTHTW